MCGICGSQDTVGDSKDASRNVNACMHAYPLIVSILTVKTFESISQDMIHTCVA